MPANILAIDTSTDICSVAIHRKSSVDEVTACLSSSSYGAAGCGHPTLDVKPIYSEQAQQDQNVEKTGEIFARDINAPRKHTEIILDMLEELLEEASLTFEQIEILAFAQGPASFTGSRIAASIVQGLAFARNLPIIKVSTLKTIAHQAWQQHPYKNILVATDAHMGEIYWAKYIKEGNILQLLGDEAIISPQHLLPTDEQQWLTAGNAWKAYTSALSPLWHNNTVLCLPDIYPCAACIAELAAEDFTLNHAVKGADATPIYLRSAVK